MKTLSAALLCSVGMMATQAFAQSSTAALDRMIAAGKTQRELAQYLFGTHGCKECYALGQNGKLGLTKKGEERAQGFEGCISTLKAMSCNRHGAGGSAVSNATSKGPTLRGVRLRYLSQGHSGQDGSHRNGSETGASSSRLRRSGETRSQQPRFTALMDHSA
jgi:hypothetical protein